MIDVSASAQTHFRRLLDSQGGDAIGILLSAIKPGTPGADVRLEFCEPVDLAGDEWSLECEGFTLFVRSESAPFLDGAQIDYLNNETGGQLNIRAPRIKGEAPGEASSLVEKVSYLLETEINPQLASHKGHVSLAAIEAGGIVVLRFGGGCHGCGMVDVTLKQGIETTLKARLPEISEVRDVTDHSTGAAPYFKAGA